MFHVIDFCRLCLSYKGDFTNLCNDIFAMEKITTCINGLELDDRLPVLICKTCMDLVDTIADFRDQCLQSEHLLNHYVEMFLAAGCTPNFVNTKLQVNVFKDFATTKTPGNVKLGCKCFQGPRQRKNLEHKSSCTVQQFKDSLRRSKAYQLHDFEEFCNNNSNEGAAAFSSIFSDDDDIFIEDDEEPQEPEVSSVNLNEHSYNKPTPEAATKRKYDDPLEDHETKKLRSEVSTDFDALAEVMTDITERVKLRKRQVQMRQTPNYAELPNGDDLSKTKKRDSKSPHKLKNRNSPSVDTAEIESVFLPVIEENDVEIVSTIEEVPNVDEMLKFEVGEVPDLSKIKKQFDANAGIATSTDFETDIEIANSVRKVEEKKKKKPQALNMGIIRIEPDVRSSEQITTSLDFENDIAAYCVAPPKPACITEPIPSLKIQPSKPSPTMQKLYEHNFSNLLKFQQINPSSGQKKTNYRLIEPSDKKLFEKKKLVKIILPANRALYSSPGKVPSANDSIAYPFTMLQSTTGKSVLIKTADLAKLSQLSKIAFSPTALSPNELVQTVTKEEPEEKVFIKSETKNEIMKTSPSSGITTDSDSEIKNKVLSYKNEPQGAGSPSKAKETPLCIISNVRTANPDDFHTAVNELVNNKSLKSERSPENFQTIVDEDKLGDDKRKKRELSPVTTNDVQTMSEHIKDRTKSVAILRKLLTDSEKNARQNTSSDSNSEEPPSGELPKFSNGPDAVLEDDRDTKKKRKSKRNKFLVDDPLNMLAFSKHRPRRLNPQNRTNRSKASTKVTPLKEKVDLIYNKVDSPGGASQVSSQSCTDLSKSSMSDSEDSEIDVVSVPYDDQNSIPVNPVPDSESGVRAENERERRVELRKHLWQLANSIPELVCHTGQKLTVKEIVRHAKLYIKALKYESELLDSEHHKLLNEQTLLARQLYHSKFGPKNKQKKGEDEPNSETANTSAVNVDD